MSLSYSFCDATSISSREPLHIRRLTHVGQKLGGGADTTALCGAKVSCDRAVEITYHQLQSCCQACARTYISTSSQ
jgi:hypothetical protein